MIWLFGSDGMLGRCVKAELLDRGIAFAASGDECDIRSLDSIRAHAPESDPAWVVNCAAYTAVDRAEQEANAALEVNRDGAANLARHCAARSSRLIHISTDYVFDGSCSDGYSESADPAPCNVYGISKEAGERAIRSTLDAHVIIRTAWLYAEHGRNFLLSILRLLGEKPELSVVNDQRGSPTYAVDLARAIVTVIQSDSPSYGTYHFTNAGSATWYDFAREIGTQAIKLGLRATMPRIIPISTDEYPTPAVRPACSILHCDRIVRDYGVQPREWRSALIDCMGRLAVGNGTGFDTTTRIAKEKPLSTTDEGSERRSLASILVTGGCGFIGSNFIRHLFDQPDFTGRVVNLDALTYAGNPDSLTEIDRHHGSTGSGRYVFHHTDIRDHAMLRDFFERYNVDTVVHFAAESHVDRSIVGPRAFIETNIVGTFNLLEAAREAWCTPERDRKTTLFHHVSTDEVYGSLGTTGAFSEDAPYDPRSPYSASKAGSDHLVRAYGHTYGLPIIVSNCSNNYGPYQFPEKMVPLMILNLFEGKELPVYGDGTNVRDWLYVEDHASAIWRILKAGIPGETYLIGGENEWRNIDLVEAICDAVAAVNGQSASRYRSLIRFVSDRPGHDLRYAVCCDKIKRELGWRQDYNFDSGLERTVAWYHENRAWVDRVRSGEYQQWITVNYANR